MFISGLVSADELSDLRSLGDGRLRLLTRPYRMSELGDAVATTLAENQSCE